MILTSRFSAFPRQRRPRATCYLAELTWLPPSWTLETRWRWRWILIPVAVLPAVLSLATLQLYSLELELELEFTSRTTPACPAAPWTRPYPHCSRGILVRTTDRIPSKESPLASHFGLFLLYYPPQPRSPRGPAPHRRRCRAPDRRAGRDLMSQTWHHSLSARPPPPTPARQR